MSSVSQLVASPVMPTDSELVARVRDGEDAAFEELYRRYQRRIVAFVRRLVGDEARAEDVTQEAFFSALRRLRVTDSEIIFKPWIYEIARNAAIDLYRRTSRAEEVSINADDLLRPSDRRRLVGSRAPDAALFAKERLNHLRGALDELSETHHRVLVMRELEGLSYREIGDRLELSRPAVESALFRARRRLEAEYEELDTGRRCTAMGTVIARLAEGVESRTDAFRLARHARRCSACRRRARELGVEPLTRPSRLARVAALFPLPALLRRRSGDGVGPEAASASQAGGTFGPMVLPGTQLGAAVAERVAALATAAALAGAGSALLGGAAHLSDHTGDAGHRAKPPAAAKQGGGDVKEGTLRDTVGPGSRTAPDGSRGSENGASPTSREKRAGPAHQGGTLPGGGDGAIGGVPGSSSLDSVPAIPPVEPPPPPGPPPDSEKDVHGLQLSVPQNVPKDTPPSAAALSATDGPASGQSTSGFPVSSSL
jgi:RNA polymerase sigma factor (sigma-70 family)